MFYLTEKTALITGGSRGIGAEIAKIFAKQNAKVIITGTNEENLRKVSSEIGMNCSYEICDLADRERLDELIKKYASSIDILVNNAGITKDNLLLRMKDEDFDEVLNINLSASFKLIKGLIRGMMKKRFGRIINISSVVASSGNPGQANYVASKAGMVGLSKSIALEIASRNITVNCISPGFIATRMTEKLTDQQKEAILKNIPAGKMGRPEDIAFTATFLASEEASYITGQNFHVNGGMYLS